ncbi:GAF domain-containing protein [Spirillospora sp. NPDC029432]|uniref:GAF domain-containing protein n=1 Tax=Spirillospora sp. NPDC029432 TaxID=3154599 RepID=UPI0034557446
MPGVDGPSGPVEARRGASSAMVRFLDPYLAFWTEADAMLETMLDAVLEVSGARSGSVQLLDPDGGLRITAHHGHGPEFLRFFAVVSDQRSACGRALALGGPVAVGDVAHSTVFAGTPGRQAMLRDGSRAVLSLPLVGPTGEVAGMVSVHYPRPRRVEPTELRLLSTMAKRGGRLLHVLTH